MRSIATAGQYGVFTSDSEILGPVAEGAFEADDVLFVQILDADGQPIVSRKADGLDTPPQEPWGSEGPPYLSPNEVKILHDDATRSEFLYPVMLETSRASDDEIVAGASPRRGLHRSKPIGTVRICLSLEELQRDLSRSKAQVVAIALAVTLVSLGITITFLRAVVSPVLHLAEGARRIAEGDFSFRASIESHDEIGRLARAFNTMSDRLQSFQHGLERKVEERTEALAAKTRDMEEFVYTVSHDLKAPVVSTHGLVSLLAEEYADQLPEDAQIYIDRIRANAGHMEKLLGDLTAMSRIDRPGTPRELVDMKAAIGEILLEHDAELRKGPVEVEVAEDLPRAYGEGDHLLQVFDNLIANAIKFREPGPGHIAVTGDVQDGHTVYRVTDDGIGIDERHQTRIFGLFQRLHTDREYPGTGLGLAIAKKIVEKHGGTMTIESEVGRGTTFTVRLPLPQNAGSSKGQDMLQGSP